MVAQQTLTLFVWVQILVRCQQLRMRGCVIEVWLSLVERYVRDVEAGGFKSSHLDQRWTSFGYIVYCRKMSVFLFF